MFDIGWTELLVIGVVALVVVGPKDLPVMFKTFGRFMARARAMARDFSRAMESAADEAGVKDVARDIKAATSPVQTGIDRLKDAADRFEKWDPSRPAAADKPSVSTTAAATSAAAQSSPQAASSTAGAAASAATTAAGAAVGVVGAGVAASSALSDVSALVGGTSESEQKAEE